MATLIELPKLSDTMDEGRIANWLKKEGDLVNEGDPLLEIETDKATMEYPSPESGVLLKILKGPGETMPLRTPIAVVGNKGEAFDLSSLVGSKRPAAAKGAPTPTSAPSSKTDASAQVSAPTVTAEVNILSPLGSGRIKASPLAKKLAKERGYDLSILRGTGPDGRIIAADVLEHKGGSVAGVQVPARSSIAATAGSQRIELSMMRKTIAKRLVVAKNDAPHFYLTISANMETLLGWREELNAEKEVRDGKLVKVSVNDLVIMAAARALRLHPAVNSSWTDDAIVQHGSVDVSMAVALPSGLITPILFAADRLHAREIAALTKTLGGKAKDGKLEPKEYAGGTFTVSNLGMTGIESFTAIINPPQACILAVGAVRAVPHVNEAGAIIAQKRMTMTMSCDHRVVDGMVGAQFLGTLVAFLEQPLKMLA